MSDRRARHEPYHRSAICAASGCHAPTYSVGHRHYKLCKPHWDAEQRAASEPLTIASVYARWELAQEVSAATRYKGKNRRVHGLRPRLQEGLFTAILEGVAQPVTLVGTKPCQRVALLRVDPEFEGLG